MGTWEDNAVGLIVSEPDLSWSKIEPHGGCGRGLVVSEQHTEDERASEEQLHAPSDPADWVDRHGDALYRYAILRLRDAELAEDIVQECLVAALDAHVHFTGRSSERTWLIGILKRKIIDHVRRSTREHAAESEPGEQIEQSTFNAKGLWAISPGRWGGDPGADAENEEFWAVFRSCLENLSPRLAEAFLLREMDQMASEEVCQVLGLTATNLWARLHRARLGLRRCLEAHWFTGRRKPN
jgi:RNA polymerase sigma-70 factor (TIGR02943 family)